MRNRIDIDYVHSRAIVREIGERLRASLKPEPKLPAKLRMNVDRLRELEEQSPSSVRAGAEGERDAFPITRKRRVPIKWALHVMGLVRPFISRGGG
jgi:hypothetical protein